jgi:hypothetical protein
MLLVSRDKRLTGPQKVAIGNWLPGKFFFSLCEGGSFLEKGIEEGAIN